MVDGVAIAPDGEMLVSGSWDRTIKIWNLSTGELLRTLEGHSEIINAIATPSTTSLCPVRVCTRVISVTFLFLGSFQILIVLSSLPLITNSSLGVTATEFIDSA
ncbi:WD40 repeat domain-containing protein [Okeania hirsuta]|uniref:WD40 repeat domain-containing protein n=1 Tax=Okeania hirsuta TaxID=1458930 RepID=UPI001F02C74A|nr:hypothetical protein [Okeania hirsuta]